MMSWNLELDDNIHDIFFHAWHWLYQQIQLNVWFGNIVAGVVVFIVVDVLWQWKVKGWVNNWVRHHLKRQSAEDLAARAEADKAAKGERDEIHRKLDHIIHHHPDIPPLPEP